MFATDCDEVGEDSSLRSHGLTVGRESELDHGKNRRNDVKDRDIRYDLVHFLCCFVLAGKSLISDGSVGFAMKGYFWGASVFWNKRWARIKRQRNQDERDTHLYLATTTSAPSFLVDGAGAYCVGTWQDRGLGRWRIR